MKKQFAQKLLYFLLLVIQIGLVTAVFVVNYLSGIKAGVYRHVYTRRMQYMEGSYNPTSIQWQSLLVVGLCIIFFILLFSSIKERRSLFYKVQIVLAILLSFFIIIVMNSELFITMMAYPYIIIVFEITLAIQLIIVIALSLKRSKQ
jgi:hypothetical protein